MMDKDTGPSRKKRHYSYDEGLDEPAKLIEDEPVEIEEGRPSEENEPVEQDEKDDTSVPPAFED